jgi:hypothetical protein
MRDDALPGKEFSTVSEAYSSLWQMNVVRSEPRRMSNIRMTPLAQSASLVRSSAVSGVGVVCVMWP